VRTRREIPAYTLRGYKLRWTVYGAGNIPVEKHEGPLPVLEPGQEHSLTLDFREPSPVPPASQPAPRPGPGRALAAFDTERAFRIAS
jgi:hypothetical protein